MLFSMSLQAVDSARNCRRSYRLVVAHDLLGDCLVTFTFGRLGGSGRTITVIAENEAHARELARDSLRRRASAPRRIGVAYLPSEQFAALGWQDLADELTRPISKARGIEPINDGAAGWR